MAAVQLNDLSVNSPQRRTVARRGNALWPWLLLALLWGVAALNYLDRQVVFSIFPLLQADLHASSVQLGLTSASFLITYGLVSPFAGVTADRFGQGRIILFSMVVWSIASYLAGHVSTISQLLITQAAMGFSEAFYIPAALGLLIRTHKERFRSLATGIHQSGCYAGIIAGGTIGGLAEHHCPWRTIFILLGCIGVAYAGVLWLVMRKRRAPGTCTDQGFVLATLARNAGLRLYTLVFVAFSIATWMLYTWLPLYLYEHFHMSLIAAGFMATFWLQTTSFAGAFLGGLLADHLARSVFNARVYVQIAGLLLACPFLAALSFADSRAVAILALVTIGLGRGCFDANTAPILAEVVSPELSSSAYGILNFAGCFVAGLTTLSGGWIRQNLSIRLVFPAAGLALLGGIWILTRVARQSTKQRKNATG